MLSEAQRIEKEEKVLQVVKEFLKTGKTNEELAKDLKMTSSTVGRYLKDKETIVYLLGNDAYEEIQQKLVENKINGLSKGGKVTQSRYVPIRKTDGKYIGNIKK